MESDVMLDHLTANDYERSCTSHDLDVVVDAIGAAVAAGRPADSLLDVGCGYGGIAATMRDRLGIPDAHGVDIDPDVIPEARAKGISADRIDVDAEPLPFDADTFGLVTCFGMLDYLPWFDRAVAEMSRVLAPGGLVAVALPNLGSWHNRLSLLLGYQPRDIEFCSRRAVGLAPYYRSDRYTAPVGHMHTATTRAFREFMDLMGFTEVRTHPLSPSNVTTRQPLRAIDSVLGRFPSTARRFLYLGRKTGAPTARSDEGWWRPAP